MYKKVPRSPYDVPLVGFAAGLIMPVFGFFLYFLLIAASKMSFAAYLKIINNPSGFAGLISLSLIVNLVPFLIAYKMKRYYISRGVLIATFVYGGYVIYLKFLV